MCCSPAPSAAQAARPRPPSLTAAPRRPVAHRRRKQEPRGSVGSATARGSAWPCLGVFGLRRAPLVRVVDVGSNFSVSS